MSLFGSIQLGANTLQAMQIGLQVTGDNIANANTPGYIRQEVIFAPAPVQQKGQLILGLGVRVEGIVQKLDRFVQERLVVARGDRANLDVQEQAYREIEAAVNELSDADLSSSFTSFFNTLDEVLNNDTAATRNLAVLRGETLAGAFGNLNDRVFNLRREVNNRVISISNQINNLAEEVRRLNVQISSTEGGSTSGSDAGPLRVRRQQAIDGLSELVDIRVNEQPSGGVSVSIGGEFLVFNGQSREVKVELSGQDGIALGTIQFADTNADLALSGGELQGLYTARDTIFGGFSEGLDDLARTLAFEFNKIYSQGQGKAGFTELTSINRVLDVDAALDVAGLPFTPVNGSFDLLVRNTNGEQATTTTTILVDLNGLDNDDLSLRDLATQLDAIDGITASVSSTGKLSLETDSPDTEFSFAEDTSGLLAALGLNTFFTGSSAGTLGINDELKGIDNANKFAASRGGIGEDSRNTELLEKFLSTPLDSEGGATITDFYDQLINDITQGSAVTQSVAEGLRIFEGTLDSQLQATSGVSIDEEAINLITLQRIYQASARFIQTVSELLDVLIRL